MTKGSALTRTIEGGLFSTQSKACESYFQDLRQLKVDGLTVPHQRIEDELINLASDSRQKGITLEAQVLALEHVVAKELSIQIQQDVFSTLTERFQYFIGIIAREETRRLYETEVLPNGSYALPKHAASFLHEAWNALEGKTLEHLEISQESFSALLTCRPVVSVLASRIEEAHLTSGLELVHQLNQLLPETLRMDVVNALYVEGKFELGNELLLSTPAKTDGITTDTKAKTA